MTDKLLIFEIFASAGILFTLVWLIKLSLLFTGMRSFKNEIFIRSIFFDLARGLVEFIATVFSKKENLVGKSSRGLELASVCLGISAGLIALMANELSTSAIYTSNLAIVSMSFIGLCAVEVSSRNWKNIDLVLMFYLKNFLVLFLITLVSIISPTENAIFFALDLLFALMSCGLFYRNIYYFCEQVQETSLVQVSCVSTLIVVSTNFLVRKTVFNMESYLGELLFILGLAVITYAFALSRGQRSRLETLEASTNSWLTFISLYIGLRLVLWII